MESNLKLSKITRLHWTIQDASQELIPQLLYRIEIYTRLLNYRGLVWLLNTLDDLVREGHTGYWTKWTDLDENSSEKQLYETCHF